VIPDALLRRQERKSIALIFVAGRNMRKTSYREENREKKGMSLSFPYPYPMDRGREMTKKKNFNLLKQVEWLP